MRRKWTDLLVLDSGKSKFGPRDGCVAYLQLLSLHPTLLVNLAEGTGLFPWASSKSVWAVSEWLLLTHIYTCTIFLARGYVLSSSSESPARLGAVRWGHSPQESHGDVRGTEKTTCASKKQERSTPLTDRSYSHFRHYRRISSLLPELCLPPENPQYHVTVLDTTDNFNIFYLPIVPQSPFSGN